MVANFERRCDHYKRYPQMIPYVGRKYWVRPKTLLFVGESHYMPKNSKKGAPQNYRSSSAWYQGSKGDLLCNQVAYTETRRVVESFLDDEPSRAYNIFRNTSSEMKEAGYWKGGQPWEYVAFFNYFQRPGLEGKSLEVNAQDADVAFEVFKINVKALTPRYVCFLSVKAWDFFTENVGDPGSVFGGTYEFFPHPCMPWWNRSSTRYAYGGKAPLTGRGKFRKFLKKEFGGVRYGGS